MSIVRELLDDAIALQKDGLSPNRIGLALTDRWEAEELGAAGGLGRVGQALAPAQRVEQGRLADVGTAHHGHLRARVGQGLDAVGGEDEAEVERRAQRGERSRRRIRAA